MCLDAEQIEAFHEMNAEAINAATGFYQAHAEGLQPERFVPTARLRLVAEGIGALLQIMSWQTLFLQSEEDEDDTDA